MVSSGQVSSDSDLLSSCIDNYVSSVSDLAGSWKGASYDNLQAKSSEFASSVTTVFEQMSSFANAINAYEEYIQAKHSFQTASNNYNAASSQGNVEEANKCSQLAQSYKGKMDAKKREIESYLSKASSGVIEASSSASAVSGSSFKSGSHKFVNYYQGNYSQPYSEGTIATSGCGPTSAAMALTYVTGREITPVETAEFGNGTYTCSAGTTWEYFADVGAKYGANCVQQHVSESSIVENLKQDKPIVMSMGPGHFTKNGHFIVLRGIDSDNKIVVADPSSEERSNQTWDINILLNEGKEMWIYSDGGGVNA